MKTKQLLLVMAICGFFYQCQNQDGLPLSIDKLKPSLTLSDGSSISTPIYEEFNPVLVHGDDLYLYLLFGSDRPCAISCANYNIFVSKSIDPYFGEVELPAFEDPLPLTQNSSPFNFAIPPNFVVKAFSGQIRVYAVESGNIRWGNALDFVSGSSYNVGAALNGITNTGQQAADILGIANDGTLFSQNGSQQIFNFDPESTGGIEIFNENLVNSYSIAHLRAGSTSFAEAAVSVLVTGEVAATTGTDLLGTFDNFNLSLELEGLNISALRFFYSPNVATDLITFSAREATGTDDIYVVTSHTPNSLWLGSFEE